MEMRNKNALNTLYFEAVFAQLDLRAFSAVNQKKPLIHIEQMSGRVSVCCGYGRITAEYRKRKSHAYSAITMRLETVVSPILSE